MKTDRKIKYDWLQGELCCRLPLARSLPCSPPVPVPVPAPVCPAPATTRCPVALISCPPCSWRAQTGAVLGQVPALRWAPPASPCPPCPRLLVWGWLWDSRALLLPFPRAPRPCSPPVELSEVFPLCPGSFPCSCCLAWPCRALSGLLFLLPLLKYS